MNIVVPVAILSNCGAKIHSLFPPSKHLTAILFAILCYGTMKINHLRIVSTMKKNGIKGK